MASNLTQNPILVFGPFRLDVSQRLLFRGNEEIPLPPKVFDTLLVLAEHHGRVLDKNYLMKTLWPDSFVEESSLVRNISLLRKTLGESPEDQKFIQTIPRRGYRFLAPVQAVPAEEPAPFHPDVYPLRSPSEVEGSHSQAGNEPAASLQSTEETHIQAHPVSAAISRRYLSYSALACLIAVILTATLVWHFRPLPAQPVTRSAVVLPAERRLLPTQDVPLAISPDGRHLVYVAQQGTDLPRLYVRPLSELADRPLPGTERANHPFFSPDGQWVGFFSGGHLRKVLLQGGPIQTICRTEADLRGASWGAGDRIIFGTDGATGLFQVSADGGTPEPLTKVATEAGETSHRWPVVLPGGRAVLFAVGTGGNYDNANIAVQRLDEKKHTVLLRGGTFPRYLPTGHLLYSRAGNILAAAFDPNRLEVSASPVPVLEGIVAPTSPIGAVPFNVSLNGTLAYLPYSPHGAANKLVWVDRSGNATELDTAGSRALAEGTNPRLSPDNQLVAIQINEQKRDIWIYSIARGTMVRLTHEGINSTPAWTPDGRRIAYRSTRGGRSNLYWQPTDGRGPEEPLTPASPATQYVGSFAPDGRVFLYAELNPRTARDIFVLPLDGDRKPFAFLQTPYDETTPRLSPDGRYVAYVSDESGRNEVYLQPFTGVGVKYRISTDGGAEVVWGKNGEIFYRSGNRMMAVAVKTQPSLELGQPQLLFEGSYLLSAGRTANYDVSADGQRFLMLMPAESRNPALTMIHLVQNWSEELKRMVPAP